MNASRDELLDLADAISVAVSKALLDRIKLVEGITDDATAQMVQSKIDALKAKLDDERQRLTKIRDAAKRRRELEKIRQDHERQTSRSAANESKTTPSRVQLLNAHGRLIGWLHTESNGKVTVYDAKGRKVAAELAGITLDRTGRLAGRGRQGLVVLGGVKIVKE